MDPAGAARVVTFHRCLLDAAEQRRMKTGEDGGDWVRERFAKPIANGRRSNASRRNPEDAAAADVVAAMVRSHGASCLSTDEAMRGLVRACESPALLAAVVSAAPELWDDALSSLSSKAGTLADVLLRLSLTGGVDDEKRWGRVRLDEAVIGAAGGGVDGSGVGALLIAAAPHVSSDAAVEVMTRLAATVRRGDAAAAGTRDAAGAGRGPRPMVIAPARGRRGKISSRPCFSST